VPDTSGPPLLTVIPDRDQINDYRLRVFGRERQRPIAFVCECDDAACRRTVVLSALAFEDLRRQRKPILFQGHLPDKDAPIAAERTTDGAPVPDDERDGLERASGL